MHAKRDASIRAVAHDLAHVVHDELGRDLSGAIIFSIQYKKGRWADRPIQLQSGDTVVSIGGERITSAAAFFRALRQHHNLDSNDHLDAGVLRPIGQAPRRFEFTTVRLDQGDLQLMYGVYTVKRR